MSPSALFKPIKVGTLQLQHRVVLSPMTRLKVNKETQVPVQPLVKTYYSQRSSVPGTLLITEGVQISAETGGWDYIPGIWSQDQVDSWKEVTKAVHANNSYIFLQLGDVGRAAKPAVLAAQNLPFVAPSPIPLPPSPETSEDPNENEPVPIPRELTKSEIKKYTQAYANAAKKAVFEAGFDGVEIHGAYGFLLDQFTQDMSNKRTDEYGGSVEGRSRFPLEVVDAIAREVGDERTAYRISPWSPVNGMRMDDPIPQFSYFVSQLAERHPNLAYLHVIESRAETESNDFIRNIWGDRPIVSVGEFNREEAVKAADRRDNQLIAFARHFLANPDLPVRLLENIPLNPYNPATFYVDADKPNPGIGYIDYPFAENNPAN